jgi:transposase
VAAQGPQSGLALLSVIGDIDDFADEGKLAAYFGIVPRVQNSNETERSGCITKRGTKLGRTTLVQCALVAKRYSPYLVRYYDRIKSRSGGGKAIIALARKFLGIIYRTLKTAAPFMSSTKRIRGFSKLRLGGGLKWSGRNFLCRANRAR